MFVLDRDDNSFGDITATPVALLDENIKIIVLIGYVGNILSHP